MKLISTKFKLPINTILIFIAFFIADNTLTGQTTFEQHAIDPDHTAVSGITCVDYDMDDDIDIIACHRVLNQVLLWENDGNNPVGWTKKVVANSLGEPLYICSKDINADDFPDLVISSASSNTVYCLINLEGENNWEVITMDDDYNSAHGICISDINDDGLADIVATAAANNTIAWWENNGNTPDSWTKHIVSDQMNGTQTVTVADINNDNFLDIIGASSDLNKVVVYYNNGDLPVTFTEQVANQSLQLPHWVSVADIDGDGNPDILVAACASGKVAWLHNDGGNPITWTQKTIGSSFGCALTVEAADIDMDGDMDVAATAYGSNRVAWWEQQQSGTQITWTIHNLSSNYKGAWPLVFSDIDNDTDMDIVTGGDLLNGLGNESPLNWWENKTVVLGIADYNTTEQNKFSIWPQPAINKVNISYNLIDDSRVTLSIYDALGNKIGNMLNENQPKGEYKIDFDLLSLNYKIKPGLYFCKLVVNNKTYINKLIIGNQQ
ncbi:MAG: T9SS type A sorting domain-containing protein [Bacteroidales bacterium]|nr:T9SS type A sorting domain-containing protein [Bacteroidales bacterium]